MYKKAYQTRKMYDKKYHATFFFSQITVLMIPVIVRYLFRQNLTL